MKVSRQQVAENKNKILEAAGRLFRERGFDAIRVADVMEAAGLTHGAFYGYFTSKNDLIEQSLLFVLAEREQSKADVDQYINRYLSPKHRDDLAGGCVFAALATDAVRNGWESCAPLANAIPSMIERFSQASPTGNMGNPRRDAIGRWSAMLGAIILARLTSDPRLSNEILREAKAWISEHP